MADNNEFDILSISKQMLDLSPINTMVADKTGKMLYMNKNSIDTLKKIEEFLPSKVDNLVGNSIDWFHEKPEVQKRIISQASNLPHSKIITVGPEKLNLLVSPIFDDQGNFFGPMVTWEVVTDRVETVAGLKGASDHLSKNSELLVAISNSLSSSAEETSAQSNTASAASEEVNAGIQTVTANMDEMVAAIREITKTTNESSALSNDAMDIANSTNDIIGKLGESSADIGSVIKVISSIAQQTNLLALNATIEAARAGEAGKGFSVVANEVKELAKQTATATQDITARVQNIQEDSKLAVNAIAQIRQAIEKINGYAGNIAASVEEQSATTLEVTRIVNESAEGVTQINENISQVSEAASNTGRDALKAQDAAQTLGDIANELNALVAKIEV